MSFLALIVGSWTFPDEAAAAAWRATEPDPASFDDWPDDGPLFSGEPVAPTVGLLLDAAGGLGGAGDPSFLEVTADGARQVVTGVIAGDEQLLRWHASLATALRAAADAGATGSAAIVVPALGAANRITLADGESAFEQVPADQVFGDDGLAAGAVALDGWLGAKAADPQLVRAAYRDGAARFWLADAPTDAEARALAAARALSDAQLAAALADPLVLAPGLEPLARVTPDAAALRAALDAGTPLARTVAIELAGHADAAATAPIALALLDHASPLVVRMAVRALAAAPGPEALEGLLRVLVEHPSEWASVANALARSTHGGTPVRVAALLADELDFDPRVLAPDVRGRRAERGRRVVETAGSVRADAVRDALFARYEDPRARWIVPRLVVALARQGGPAVEARAQELQLAMMGMGKALNPDHARRAALLAIEGEEDSGGIIRYDDLDLARLTTLLDEGFVHPEAAQNDAPRVGDFFQLMTQWPELRATGYAVSPARPDYRVMIDGISADLAALDADRAAGLRAAIEPLAESATQAELDGDQISVWWT